MGRPLTICSIAPWKSFMESADAPAVGSAPGRSAVGDAHVFSDAAPGDTAADGAAHEALAAEAAAIPVALAAGEDTAAAAIFTAGKDAICAAVFFAAGGV